MKIFSSGPWALSKDGLSHLSSMIATDTADNIEALEALEFKEGVIYQGEESLSIREGGVAVIPVQGMILRRPRGFLSWFFNLASTDQIAKAIRAAGEDDEIKSIILNIDSPGGEVSGLAELVDHIYEARWEKPITAYIDGGGMSAAYWLASAADNIVVSKTSLVGSVGVVATYRKKNNNEIEVVSSQSRNKRADPQTKQGREEVQKLVDSLADVMIDSIARNRGVSSDKVLADYGQGAVIVGEDAVSAGLADRLGSFEGLVDSLSTETDKGGLFKMETDFIKMLNEVKAGAPELITAIETVALEGAEEGAVERETDARAEGASQERERVVGILAVEGADIEAQVQAIKSGITIEAAYKMFFEAAQRQKAEKLAALESGAPEPIVPKAEGDPAPGDSKITAVAKRIAAEKAIPYAAALEEAKRVDPAAAKDWAPQ